jgi:Uma2 family endonuclease
MPSPATLWTVEMLHGLPEDGNRYEVIEGELYVTPSPTRGHERVAKRLGQLLDAYVAKAGLAAEVFAIDADIRRDKHTLVQPDVLVIDAAREADHASWPPMHGLMLAVEVLSPSTSRRDRTTKRALYLGEGVEYWIVDPEARAIERWDPFTMQSEILRTELTWQPAGATAPLVIRVPELFEPPKF